MFWTRDAVAITPNKTDSATYSVIVAPQTVASGTKLFTIVLNGDEYVYTTAKAHIFASNTASTTSIRIMKVKITPADEITVGEWGTGDVIADSDDIEWVVV